MRKLIKSFAILTLPFVMLLNGPIVASAQQTGFAKLHRINQSGIKAALIFSDNGGALRVRGVATGLDPTQTYVTLLYDVGSVARGNSACLPTDNSLTFTQMVVNFWRVDDDGNGTLRVRKTGASYAPLPAVGTASIRRDTQAGQPLPSAADPNRFVLQACGKVRK